MPAEPPASQDRGPGDPYRPPRAPGGMLRRAPFPAILRLGAGVCGVFLLLAGFASLTRPNLAGQPPETDAAAASAVWASRQVALDRTAPPQLYRSVDYSTGPEALWFPKGESPVLAELVAKGKLPPVAERVGPEPLVWEGCDGVGRYGGTWISGDGTGDLYSLGDRFSSATLVRWSPQGHPLVPGIAKGWEISTGPDGQPDYRNFTFHLRKGMRWSDGTPFTADDILYWWEQEATDPDIVATPPPFMFIHGKLGRVEKVADDRVRFSFPEPHGLFLDLIASARGLQICSSPKHYLGPYHPKSGNPDLIARSLAALKLNQPKALYLDLKYPNNPEHPRLWPWVYRQYTPNAPFLAVRNPYFWIVDTAGNQLPYIDARHMEERSRDVAVISLAGGEFTFATLDARGEDYSLIMAGREKGGYEVYHWYRADRAFDTVSINLNLKTDYADPERRHEAELKGGLLRDRRFRQALSLALDRREIITADYNNLTEPAQVAPGPDSLFYHEGMYRSFTEYAPDRANQLLDEAGLTRRNREGFRTFADGTPLTLMLNFCTWYRPSSPAEYMVEHWRRVGLRVVPRPIDSSLFYTEKAALRHDLSIFPGDNEHEPLIEPRTHVPVSPESNWAIGYAAWWTQGGPWGLLDGRELPPGSVEPDADSEPGRSVRRAMELYGAIQSTGNRTEQKALYDQIQDIAAENVWTVSVCTMPPLAVVVKNGLRNVPRVGVFTYDLLSPGNTGLETFFFDNPQEIPGLQQVVQNHILETRGAPDSLAGQAAQRKSAGRSSGLLRALFGAIGLGLLAMAVVRHPFLLRRLLLMVPTLFVISLIVFVVIQLPPGDYLTSRIMELQAKGDQVSENEIASLRELYGLDEPQVGRYLRWMGLRWFVTLKPQDQGLLQGNLGRSMLDNRPVNQVVGDRIAFTLLISLGSILFTWAIAVPVGIYSAVRQYSPGDYIVTFLGFIGMCIPSFLLALLLMFAARAWFDTDVSGLFSTRYGAQPTWDLPKFLDLLKHIWVPVVILGIGGTAGMIRVMRANLLDELRKPYVTTARAKGVRPIRLLLKYPVRLALNPFVSGIGGLFPYLISGAAVVDVMLSLPTVGPLLLRALQMQDMDLAGSMLLVLSLLGVLGVLVSDLLLLWLDPRIRYGSGAK